GGVLSPSPCASVPSVWGDLEVTVCSPRYVQSLLDIMEFLDKDPEDQATLGQVFWGHHGRHGTILGCMGWGFRDAWGRHGDLGRRGTAVAHGHSCVHTVPPVVPGGGLGTDPIARAPQAGFGYGLPISRLYAKYFQGDLQLFSMEGFGTDAVIYLKALSTDSVERLPVYNKSAWRHYQASQEAGDWSVPSTEPKNTSTYRVP
ncbi:pyruvate dehydrogenase kinase, isozyme 2, partial [Numida meleagris]|uniref:pyruvate dehydrogenase kinase, isozyme 2 n=1 Tax=Numida meleagris TaxID=8996 RepID=UPI000B3D944E